MTGNHRDTTTYTFGRRDRGGVLLGLRISQLVPLAVGFGAIFFGALLAGAPGGLLGCAVLAVTALLALFPIQGRPVVDWARPLANYAHARVLGRTAYLGGPTALYRTKRARIDLPGLGQHLRVYEARTLDGRVAALKIANRWTIVLKVRGSNYVLADRATQERRISDWGALLSQCGQEGSRIAALQWLERTVPDGGHDLSQWWSERGDASAPYAAAYATLIERAGPAATRHDAYLAVSVDARKLRRPIRQAGGGPEGTWSWPVLVDTGF